MQWLLDHSVANMYGPHFLVLYATVIILTLGTCWWMLQRRVISLYSESESSTMFLNAKVTQATFQIKLAGACVILGLGGYKLVIALAKGRYNVGFLILMCVVALCILFAMRASSGRKNDDRSKKDGFVSKGAGQ